MADETRDIAVEAKSLVNQHMADCKSFRQSLIKTFDEIKEDAKDTRADIKVITNRQTYIVAGLVLIAKAFDIAEPFLAKLIHLP